MQKIRSIFDAELLKTELSELEYRLQTPEVWSNQQLASELGQKVRELKDKIDMILYWDSTVSDAEAAYDIGDEELIKEIE